MKEERRKKKEAASKIYGKQFQRRLKKRGAEKKEKIDYSICKRKK